MKKGYPGTVTLADRNGVLHRFRRTARKICRDQNPSDLRNRCRSLSGNADGKQGNRTVPYHSLCHRTENKPLEAAAAMRTHDNHVGSMRIDGMENTQIDIPQTDFCSYADVRSSPAFLEFLQETSGLLFQFRRKVLDTKGRAIRLRHKRCDDVQDVNLRTVI